MATPSKQNKILIEYNCKNGVYSLDGTTVKPLGYLASVTAEKNTSSTEKYGDGELQLTLINDKGSTGTLELTARDTIFERDLGFLKSVSQGLAEVQVLENKSIAVGFECYYTGTDGVTKTKKVWFLGVNVSPAGESLSQNTDSTNESTASYGITIKGVNLNKADGSDVYRDANGNTIKVFKISSIPSNANYATFLDSVPTPTAVAEYSVTVSDDAHTDSVTITNQYGEVVTNKAYTNDNLTIVVKPATGYEIDTLTVNANNFTNGSTHTVSGNVAVVVTTQAITD